MGVNLLSQTNEALLRRQFYFFDDFDNFVSGDRWTDTSGDSGATIVGTDAACSTVVLTTGATDNNEAYLLSTRESFLFAANKPSFCECRLKWTEANTDDANVAFGFMNAVGADSILDNGGGPKASYSGAVFFKIDGETRWNVESSLAGTQTTTALTAANSLNKQLQSCGAGTYQTLRIECVPISTTEVEISFFIDESHVQKHTITYTNATEMNVFVGVKAGDTNSEVVTVDYISAGQLR